MTRKLTKPGYKKPTHVRYHDEVAAKDIDVDPDVQRMFDPNLANRLEANWDPKFVGTVVLSKRADGTYWVIDGQHRCHVAKLKDTDAVMAAEVHEGLTPQEEAQMFIMLNRERKAVRPYDNFRIAVKAGMPLETSVNIQVQGRGLEVAVSPSANKVAAVQALLSIAARDVDQTGLVADVLDVAKSAWGRSPESWDNMVLRALGTVIHKNRANIKLARLTKVLAKHPVGQWKASAVKNAVGGGGSESRANRLVEIIATAYNSGLRTKGSTIRA